MKRTVFLFALLISFLLQVQCIIAQELKEKLALKEGVSDIVALESSFAEKYVFFITQPLDHQHPEKGSFRQRVFVCHTDLDSPAVIVTEGYGARYAMSPVYRDELSRLFNTNIIVVEHRYFLESTPSPLDWQYLTAENSANDLHKIRMLFDDIYKGKWISTGISKGGQTTMIYRAFFPDDVDISVPYVAPLCRGEEDGRHEKFLRKVGKRAERKSIKNFQTEVLKRKNQLLPEFEKFCNEQRYTFRIPIAEVLDYCVLEYSFAFWQWGTPVSEIPSKDADNQTLLQHLLKVSGPDYFVENSPNGSFFVQASKELGYYGYDTKPFRKYLTVKSSKGYLQAIMTPQSALPVTFDPALYNRIYNLLKNNDPKMLFIYGEVDPWSAVHVPVFKKKNNEHVFFQPGGSHRTRIGTMPDEMRNEILTVLNNWLY